MKKALLIILAILAFSCSEDPIEDTGFGTISGSVVLDGENTPLANVKISTNPVTNTVFTDADGAFIIEEAPVGDYSVQADLEGYITAFEAARVEENRTNNIVFELEVSTANNKAPLKPVLVTPEDTSVDVATTVDFVWTSGSNDEDELTYTLELRNITANTSEYFENLIDTTLSVSSLQRGAQYIWQITVTDDINQEVLSEVSQFSTIPNPANAFHFARVINGNSVIFSSDQNGTDVVQLTHSSHNSFRPRKNTQAGKVAFLRTVGGDTHIFTMNLDGTATRQITAAIPVNGFRLSAINFAWAQNGSKIYYPNFDKLYSINPDGSGRELLYQTTDGSLISEVATTDLNDNIIVLKTNNTLGYDTRIFTVSLSAGTEETIILENEDGASGGIDLSANADEVIYTRDISGSENSSYRIFQSRLFKYDLNSSTETQIQTDVDQGENDLEARWSPSEGEIILTRKGNNSAAEPAVYMIDLNSSSTSGSDIQLFPNASMPDWE